MSLFGVARGLGNTLAFMLQHPLNSEHKLQALRRFASWQVASRLAPGPIAVPYVNNARLLVGASMKGATGCVYCGLHEYADMAFLLHALRPDDLFVDVGANVGSYTILASAAVGCATIALEPIAATYASLLANIQLNHAGERATALNVGCGAKPGTLEFTSDLDTVNHVATAEDPAAARISVPIQTLDAILAGRSPALIKIDVEGFESEVLAGAAATLADPALFAVIMEMNGSGTRYGVDETALHRDMLARGFVPALYDPRTRELTEAVGPSTIGNTLYVRDLLRVRDRVRTAPAFSVLGQTI